jgi:ribosomal protein S18 acetylase RimI-like enzyme
MHKGRFLLNIQRVHDASDPGFADLVRIYTEAHPASERKSVDLLSSMVNRREYLFLLAFQDRQSVGFSIVQCFHSSDACLLEYMAVAHDRRDQGIGQYLFKETVNHKEVSNRFLLAEVDSNKRPSAETTLNTRRKAFYRRLGCREIEGLNYLMPNVSSAAPPAMDLIVYRDKLPISVEKSHLRDWLECCFVQTYGRPADDPNIDSMLKDLPGNLRLI